MAPLRNAPKQDLARMIKVNTGVVNRTMKEYNMYCQEVAELRAAIAKLEAESADVHDIKRKNDELSESDMMVNDTKKRLQAAGEKLQSLAQQAEDEANEAITSSEDFSAAKTTLDSYAKLNEKQKQTKL